MFVEHGHLVMEVMELSSNLPEFTMNQSFRFSLQFVFSSFNDSGLSVYIFHKVYPGSVHSKRLKFTLRSPIGIHNFEHVKIYASASIEGNYVDFYRGKLLWAQHTM